MATKRVGVRELKEGAAALVRRAEKGERIVITRHGAPAAVLGPVGADVDEGALPPRTRAWRRERAAFEGLSSRLQRKYRGRWVAVLDGRVVGDDDEDPDALFERVWRRFGRPFYVGRVGASPTIVDMPGFDLE